MTMEPGNIAGWYLEPLRPDAPHVRALAPKAMLVRDLGTSIIACLEHALGGLAGWSEPSLGELQAVVDLRTPASSVEPRAALQLRPVQVTPFRCMLEDDRS